MGGSLSNIPQSPKNGQFSGEKDNESNEAKEDEQTDTEEIPPDVVQLGREILEGAAKQKLAKANQRKSVPTRHLPIIPPSALHKIHEQQAASPQKQHIEEKFLNAKDTARAAATVELRTQNELYANLASLEQEIRSESLKKPDSNNSCSEVLAEWRTCMQKNHNDVSKCRTYMENIKKCTAEKN